MLELINTDFVLDRKVIPFGAGIRYLRRMRQWNCKALADNCGVSPRTVESWEQGRYIPKKPVILLLKILLYEHDDRKF